MRPVPAMRRIFLRSPLLVAAALGLTSGCASPSDGQKELETVRSWTATAALATDERRVGAIPGPYAKGLVEAARAARTEAAQSLATSGTSASDRARATLALDSLDRAIGRLAALDAAR
jgi:hypothetical protein